MRDDFLSHFNDTVFRFIDESKKTRNAVNADQYREDLNLKYGYGAFFTVNGFDKSPKRENLSVLNSFFADIDGISDSSKIPLDIEPTYIIRTKNGFHLYWMLDEPIFRKEIPDEAEWQRTLLEYEEIELALIVKVGGDKNAKDVTRVLRVPGSTHWKDPKDPFRITIQLENHAKRYSMKDLRDMLGVREQKPSDVKKYEIKKRMKNEFFTTLEEKFPLMQRQSVQALLSGAPGTIPTEGSELERSRNRALLVAATVVRNENWPIAKAFEHFAKWHGMENERGGQEEIRQCVISAYKNDYHFGYKEACLAWNSTEEEKEMFRRAVASVLKERKEIDKAHFAEYEKDLARRWPYLKKSDTGIFFNYEAGVYVRKSDIEIEDMILLAMDEDGLWGYRTRNAVKDKMNCLRSITPIVRENEREGVLNVKNGLVDMAKGTIAPHDPGYVSFVQLPVEYDAKAECPLFSKFLDDAMEGMEKEEKKAVLSEFSGSCLSPSTRYSRALFLIGDGYNGKSTFAEAIARVVGDKGTSHISLEDLYTHFGVIGIFGKRLNICEEIPGNYFQSHKIKALVSGEEMTTNVKYKDQFTFRPQAKFIFAVNEMPRVDDTSRGTERRLLTVRFLNSFEGKDNRELRGSEGQLAKEASGILNWMIRGYLTLMEQKEFTYTEEHAALLRDYREEISSPDAFVGECFIFEEEERLSMDGMYEHYKRYCDTSGLKYKSRRWFVRLLRMMPACGKQFHVYERRNGHGETYVKGLKATDAISKSIFSPYKEHSIGAVLDGDF